MVPQRDNKTLVPMAQTVRSFFQPIVYERVDISLSSISFSRALSLF